MRLTPLAAVHKDGAEPIVSALFVAIQWLAERPFRNIVKDGSSVWGACLAPVCVRCVWARVAVMVSNYGREKKQQNGDDKLIERWKVGGTIEPASEWLSWARGETVKGGQRTPPRQPGNSQSDKMRLRSYAFVSPSFRFFSLFLLVLLLAPAFTSPIFMHWFGRASVAHQQYQHNS